jgi:hypothetical protein
LCLERQWKSFIHAVKIAYEYEVDIEIIKISFDGLWRWINGGCDGKSFVEEPVINGWNSDGSSESSGFALYFTQAVQDLVISSNKLDKKQPGRCASRNIEQIETLSDYVEQSIIDGLYKREMNVQFATIDMLKNGLSVYDPLHLEAILYDLFDGKWYEG